MKSIVEKPKISRAGRRRLSAATCAHKAGLIGVAYAVAPHLADRRPELSPLAYVRLLREIDKIVAASAASGGAS